MLTLLIAPLEDLAEDAALLAQLFQRLFILLFQIRTREGIHIRPAVALRDARLLSVGRLGILVGHFEEDQVCKLLQIIAVGNAVVPQRAAHAPDLGDDG